MNSPRAYVVCLVIWWSCWSTIEALKLRNPEGAKTKVSQKNTASLYSKETLRDVIEPVMRYGYSISEHEVETEDGYVLTMFRVQRQGNSTHGPPVLLMHGLLLSATSWLDAGPGVALGYLLAAAGHDVWLGNVRGTHYSRRHAALDPDLDALYWRFSVDEIGRYDHPAFIEYILSHTGANKLNYIGFSQGCGTFFIMCSERPEYRDKVNVMIALAPATRHLFTKSIVFRTANEYYEKREKDLIEHGIWEALPKGGPISLFLQHFCPLSDVATKFCEIALNVLDAFNPGSIPRSALLVAVKGMPAGTSVHNMARYGQSLRSTDFVKFDYGPEQNLVKYGSETPPAYNLSAVTVPAVIMYGRNDGIVDIRDVKWVLRKLPNVLEAVEVEDQLWTHLDMSFSKRVPQLLYPKVKGYLDKFSQR